MSETTIDRAKLRETVVHIRDSYPEAWNYAENLDIRALADCAIEALDALDAAEARVQVLERFVLSITTYCYQPGSTHGYCQCVYCHKWGEYIGDDMTNNNIQHKGSCEVLEARRLLYPDDPI